MGLRNNGTAATVASDRSAAALTGQHRDWCLPRRMKRWASPIGRRPAVLVSSFFIPQFWCSPSSSRSSGVLLLHPAVLVSPFFIPQFWCSPSSSRRSRSPLRPLRPLCFPLRQISGVPQFRGSAVPGFRSSGVPQFRGSAVPGFRRRLPRRDSTLTACFASAPRAAGRQMGSSRSLPVRPQSLYGSNSFAPAITRMTPFSCSSRLSSSCRWPCEER